MLTKKQRYLLSIALLLVVTVMILWLCSTHAANQAGGMRGQIDGYREGYQHGQQDRAFAYSFAIPSMDESLFPAHAPEADEAEYNLYRSHFFNSYGGGYSDGYEGNPSCYP